MNNQRSDNADFVFPISSAPHPQAPNLSMDQYVRFLQRGRLFGNYRIFQEEALHRKPPTEKFVIAD